MGDARDVQRDHVGGEPPGRRGPRPRWSLPWRPGDPKRPVAKVRVCLCCGRTFKSWGAGNRICEPCKGTEGYRFGDDCVF